MSKAEDKAAKKALETFPILFGERMGYDKTNLQQERRNAFEKGYHQAEKDIKEELSKLFREFMMDCVNDSTDTHILHFVEVFNNKIKTIGNE